jgi:2,4-dichlorophenol 6-monooxygenase
VTTKIDFHVPVLIVGGGGAGLTASILLSNLGVRSLLANRHPGTSRVPRAHILNQRTMEIFSDAGVADAILERSAAPENMRGVGFYTALAGGGPADGHGRRLGFIEGWGGGHTDPDYVAASPCRAANLSLLRAEPILKAYAERLPEATVRFHHELVDLEQDDDGVTSTILDRDTGETYTVRSSYVLGADGGRTVADLVGIKVSGHQKTQKLISLYVTADLSPYLGEADDAMLIWVYNPEFPSHLQFGTTLIPQGPKRWGRESEEWQIALFVDDIDTADTDAMVEWSREALGIPDFDPVVHAVSEWWLETLLADEFRAGRVFLVGDAAHRVPPTGGLGLNSAVHDAHNLCWKIAAVLVGRAGDGLLDTYEAERRPVNQASIDAAVGSAAELADVSSALGVSPDKSVEANWAELRLFWEDLPGAAERRHEFSRYLGRRTVELRQHNVDFGYTYDSAAVVGDGSSAPVPLDAVRLYQPSTRPGHPLPHAWVERSCERLALRCLVHDGHFALIAGEDGRPWVQAATKIAEERGIPLRAARVGIGDDVDLVDVRLAWLKQREISQEGAVLVRPDGFIGFRSATAVDDPLAALASALDAMLSNTTMPSHATDLALS